MTSNDEHVRCISASPSVSGNKLARKIEIVIETDEDLSMKHCGDLICFEVVVVVVVKNLVFRILCLFTGCLPW